MEVIDDIAIRIKLPTTMLDSFDTVERYEVIEQNDKESTVLICWDHPEVAAVSKIIDSTRPDMTIPNLPSPMVRDYKFSGLYTPYSHQKDTASFLSVRQRAFCFSEAGTGKTSSSLWAADYLMKEGLVNRVLVICPVSIMYTAWQDEVFKSVMHRTCGVAHGSKEKRKKIIRGDYDIVIINYDGIGVVHDELIAGGFDLIIVDEANAYKNSTTQRWRKLAKLIKSNTWLWMMTGTPAAQSPMDAFGLSKMVSPYRVPKFMTAWRDKVMVQVTRFKWMPKMNAKSIVHSALQPAIRYNKIDCVDLPPVVYQTRDVPLSPQAAKYYVNLKRQLQIEAGGEQVSAVNAAAALNKLLQISGGAVYADQGAVLEFDISPRLKELKNVLEETVNKVIVFVPYTHTIQVVQQFLFSQEISNEIINGEVTAKKRAEIITRFQQQEDPRVLVIQPQAASHGVTLTAADTVVFWSPVLSVETYLQCIARIDRVGQKNKMLVVHLQGSDVERKTYSVLHSKVHSHNQLVDLYKQVLDVEDSVNSVEAVEEMYDE